MIYIYMWNYVYMILTIILQITYKWFQKAANSLQRASVWGEGTYHWWCGNPRTWDIFHMVGTPLVIDISLGCFCEYVYRLYCHYLNFIMIILAFSLSSLSLLLLLLSLFLQLSLCVLSSLPSFLIIHIYLFIMITTSILYVYSQRDFIITTLIITIVTIIIIINISQKHYHLVI